MNSKGIEEKIKLILEKEINDHYTEIKKRKLKELDNELEFKRNESVKEILNSITILNNDSIYGLNIMIKVENKIVLKK